MNSKTDIELIKEAQKGDQLAFTALFNRYHKRMFRFVKSIVKNNLDAEDITMRTFEKAFANIGPYVPLFEFRTWLFTIAKNTALDFVYYVQRRPTNVEVATICFSKVEIETPEQILISKQNVEIVERSIQELPFVYRRVIDLREDGFMCKEISDKLGISINTVVGQIRRAKELLNVLLTNKLVS
jgi:RNA polymerase sigma-70 factor, ECF subfamily